MVLRIRGQAVQSIAQPPQQAESPAAEVIQGSSLPGDPAPLTAGAQAQPKTLLKALALFATGQTNGLTIRNLKTGNAYDVLGYEPESRQVSLRAVEGHKMRVRVGDREDALYEAVWR